MERLPKIELHLHLDCSLSYSVVSRLDRSISREQYNREFIAPPRCTSLADFLTRAPRGFQLMQDEESLRLVVEDLFEQLAGDGVVYAEIRFAPLLHTARGMRPEAIVAAVDRATEACVRSTGIEARLILCTLRHFSAAQGLETAQPGRNDFKEAASRLSILPATKKVLPSTRTCLRSATRSNTASTAPPMPARRAERRASGKRCARFSLPASDTECAARKTRALLDHLRAQRIHLEICPSSNVQTCAVASYAEHPVDSLYRSGVPLGINTDARTITNISLSQEYARLRDQFGWGHREFLACNLEALRAAFVDDAVKLRLSEKIERARIHRRIES